MFYMFYMFYMFTYFWWTPIAIHNLAAAVNCGESVCTIGICYVVNKIIFFIKIQYFTIKIQRQTSKKFKGEGALWPCMSWNVTMLKDAFCTQICIIRARLRDSPRQNLPIFRKVKCDVYAYLRVIQPPLYANAPLLSKDWIWPLLFHNESVTFIVFFRPCQRTTILHRQKYDSAQVSLFSASCLASSFCRRRDEGMLSVFVDVAASIPQLQVSGRYIRKLGGPFLSSKLWHSELELLLGLVGQVLLLEKSIFMHGGDGLTLRTLAVYYTYNTGRSLLIYEA
jgi:hypothetical protein